MIPARLPLLLTLYISLLCCVLRVEANEHGVESLGPARFTVITPQLIRMEYASDGKFIDAPSWFARNRTATTPAIRLSEIAGS